MANIYNIHFNIICPSQIMKCFTFDPPLKNPPGAEFKVSFLHNSYCIRKTKIYQVDAVRGLNVQPWPS